MLKKLTGLFILLCFFLVKSTPLFAAHKHEHQQNVMTCCAEQNTADQNTAGENEDSQKECKQFEIADEDFIGQPAVQLNAITLNKKLRPLEILCVPAPYIALPYPPPNFL